jgi:pimeloyl-ACP methyl ester carboxylesterase
VLAWSPIVGPSRRTRPLRNSEGGIARLAPVTLGGVKQWVLVRGRHNAPILLKLHGGPGQAEIPTIHMNAALEGHFLVVEWDQRGAGKSAAAIEPKSAVTLDRIVSDTIELAEHLRAEFVARKFILCGHSWGSLVGVLASQLRPDLFDAFVSTGQIVKFAEGQIAAHEWAIGEARRRNNTAAIEALSSLPSPPFPGPAGRAAWMKCVRWLGEFGAMWQRPAEFRPVPWMIASPEYAWAEKLRFTKAAAASFELLYDDLMRADLFSSCASLAVPVFVAAGRYDRMAPTEIAERYLDSLVAPHKEWEWFESSGHFPQWEEPDKFLRFLIDRVLPGTAD